MRPKLTALLFCFYLLASHKLQAQQHLVDSITKELKGDLPDTTRAISMMRLAVDLEIVDTAKAYQAYRDAIKFASSKRLYYQLGRIYQNQAFLFNTAGDQINNRKSLDAAIENYRKSNHPKALTAEASSYGDYANAFKAENDLETAIQFHLKAIKILEGVNAYDKLVVPYANIGNLFGDVNDTVRHKEYAFKSLEAAKKTNHGPLLFTSNFMVTHFFNRIGDTINAKKYLDSARTYARYSNADILFSFYLISGDVFKKMNRYDSAIYFFKEAYNTALQANYGYGKAEAQVQLGGVSIQAKRYADAEKYLVAGVKEAEEVNNYNVLDEAYKYVSDLYAVTGRYKEAYEWHQKYKDLSDSNFNADSRKNMMEQEKKYETEKKEAQIIIQNAKIQRKNTLNSVLIAGLVVLVILSLLLYRNYRQKQKLQRQQILALERSQQLTATEAVLKGEEQERTRLAKDLHDGLGGMLSGIKYSFQTMKGNLVMTPENQQAFERSMDMLDSSINEMRRVAHNMMPEALVKFGLDTALRDFCNDINKTGALQVNYQSIGIEKTVIDQTVSITIFRIVQELLTNTLKHAGAKTAIVQLSKSNGSITITVEDDGKGFDPSVLDRARGIGWSNIQSRILYLKGKTDIRSEQGKGTSVHIELNT